jgi:uncharacterized membrane protein YphA (DoxX/SURF4 family)
MFFQRNLYLLVGRSLLGLAFFIPAIMAIQNPEAILALKTITISPIFFWLAVLFMLIGSLSLILGIYTDGGVIVLLLFLVPYSVVFHSQFNTTKELIDLLQKLALMGGLIYVYLLGPGEWNIVTEERYLLAQYSKSKGKRKKSKGKKRRK